MEITISFPVVHVNQTFLQELNLEEFVMAEVNATLTRLKANITSGKDANGRALKPYSASYIKAIDSGYVAGKSPGNHTPNLTATQTLLRSMRARKGKGQGISAEVFFEGAHPPARRVSRTGAKRKQALARKAGYTLTTSKRNGTPRKAAPRKEGKKSSKGITNAGLANALYRMGYTGWFQFGEEDMVRISRNLNERVNRLLLSLLQVK